MNNNRSGLEQSSLRGKHGELRTNVYDIVIRDQERTTHVRDVCRKRISIESSLRQTWGLVLVSHQVYSEFMNRLCRYTSFSFKFAPLPAVIRNFGHWPLPKIVLANIKDCEFVLDFETGIPCCHDVADWKNIDRAFEFHLGSLIDELPKLENLTAQTLYPRRQPEQKLGTFILKYHNVDFPSFGTYITNLSSTKYRLKDRNKFEEVKHVLTAFPMG